MKYYLFLISLFGFSFILFLQQEKTSLPYIIEEPLVIDENIKYPLVVCLHGAGGRGNDNMGRGSEAFKVLNEKRIKEKYPSFLLVPQCPKQKKWVNVEWKFENYSIDEIPISDELHYVSELIDSIIRIYPIDKSKVYITGQSMGGFGTWDLILRRPELFAAAIPVCGGGDTSKVDRLRNIGVWIFHGEIDNKVPVEASREMYAAMKMKHIDNVKYTEFEGVKHNSWTPAWSNDLLIDWLFRQKKMP